MTPMQEFLKRAALTTSKGAAITLGSTVVSCLLACYIEAGAHRLVYRYFPHKYANVDQAYGLTQEQLDAVRIYRKDNAASEWEGNERHRNADIQSDFTPAKVSSKVHRQKNFSLLQDMTLFSSSTESRQTRAKLEENISTNDVLASALTG